ncbi:hypothetical protein D9M68_660680 [compost metagenome]
MRINLNERSTKQLNEVMQILGYENPTHTVQTMITSLLNSLSIPSIEDTKNNGDSKKEGMSRLPN